jgi:putative heme iron utilization protein
MFDKNRKKWITFITEYAIIPFEINVLIVSMKKLIQCSLLNYRIKKVKKTNVSKHKELLNEFIIRCDYQCLVQLRKVGAYSVSSAGATLSYSNFLGLLSFINFK